MGKLSLLGPFPPKLKADETEISPPSTSAAGFTTSTEQREPALNDGIILQRQADTQVAKRVARPVWRIRRVNKDIIVVEKRFLWLFWMIVSRWGGIEIAKVALKALVEEDNIKKNPKSMIIATVDAKGNWSER